MTVALQAGRFHDGVRRGVEDLLPGVYEDGTQGQLWDKAKGWGGHHYCSESRISGTPQASSGIGFRKPQQN